VNPWSTAQRGRLRPARVRTVILACLAATASLVLAPWQPPAEAAAPLTVVSITFDDANADQLAAASTLASNGLHGTFFVPSGFVGASGYLTVSDLTSLAAAGHEIGGHTVTHLDLTTLSTDEATRQICNDRVNLTNWGFSVRSLAYPFAAVNAAVRTIVANCGYNSARGLGDLASRFGCSGCPYAETIPPENALETKALDEVDSNWTLQDLQNSVTNAQTEGGWVQLTFHHVCTGCDPLAVNPTLFANFASWLHQQTLTTNTVVQTVGAVVGGSVQPAVPGPAVPPAPPGANGAPNASLETAGAGGLPSCWMAGGYGTNTPTWARVTGAHSGQYAERLVMSGYVSGDAKLLPMFDLGACAPSVTAGRTYSVRAWYKSTAVTQFALYYRTGVGTWSYWTSSPWFAASASYVQAVWTTPPIPAGATAISFGLNLFSNGTLTTDDYALYDSEGAPAP
jgi:peptidoglycan/xylan/chitin deacetylase (PgdA/CDA1 family)